MPIAQAGALLARALGDSLVAKTTLAHFGRLLWSTLNCKVNAVSLRYLGCLLPAQLEIPMSYLV